MVAQRPGVYVAPVVAEPELRPERLDVAGFVGVALRGPVNSPVAVRRWSEYERQFGGFEPAGNGVERMLPHAVAAYFAQGGRLAYVVRVAPPYRAARRADWSRGDPDATASYALPGLTAPAGPVLVAADEGAWGNALDVVLRFETSRQAVGGDDRGRHPAAARRHRRAGRHAAQGHHRPGPRPGPWPALGHVGRQPVRARCAGRGRGVTGRAEQAGSPGRRGGRHGDAGGQRPLRDRPPRRADRRAGTRRRTSAMAAVLDRGGVEAGRARRPGDLARSAHAFGEPGPPHRSPRPRRAGPLGTDRIRRVLRRADRRCRPDGRARPRGRRPDRPGAGARPPLRARPRLARARPTRTRRPRRDRRAPAAGGRGRRASSALRRPARRAGRAVRRRAGPMGARASTRPTPRRTTHGWRWLRAAAGRPSRCRPRRSPRGSSPSGSSGSGCPGDRPTSWPKAPYGPRPA